MDFSIYHFSLYPRKRMRSREYGNMPKRNDRDSLRFLQYRRRAFTYSQSVHKPSLSLKQRTLPFAYSPSPLHAHSSSSLFERCTLATTSNVILSVTQIYSIHGTIPTARIHSYFKPFRFVPRFEKKLWKKNYSRQEREVKFPTLLSRISVFKDTHNYS